MPKYEKIRNKLTREAQKPVPKASRVWVLINSGFFLWVLSALLLTLGGGYVTNHQACMREADHLVDRREKLSREMYSRRQTFHETVAQATSIEDLVLVPTTKGSLYPDLEKMPYYELEADLRKLRFRTEYDELTPNAITDVRDDMNRILINFVIKSDDFTDPIKSKNPSKEELDDFLRFRKLLSEFNAQHTKFDGLFEDYVLNFQPDCSIAKTFQTALGNRPDIIRATSHSSVTPEVLAETKKYLEAAQVAFKRLVDFR